MFEFRLEILIQLQDKLSDESYVTSTTSCSLATIGGTLWNWCEAIIDHLGSLRLTIHENKAQVRPVTEGVPFLGFYGLSHPSLAEASQGDHLSAQASWFAGCLST